jgi:cell division septum initiation protein DivIVA
MPEDTLGPDTFSTRGIPTARRGYDRKVVDALVADAVAAWGALEKRYGELIAEIERSGGLQHLSRDLGAIAADVGRVLTAATEAADGIRSRAQADADRVAAESAAASSQRLEAAAVQAASIVGEADRQAFDLRRDAWEAGMGLLVSVQQAIADVLAAADDEAQMIRADAEKENHRRLAMIRKEAGSSQRQVRGRPPAQPGTELAEMSPGAGPRVPGDPRRRAPPPPRDHGRDRTAASEAPSGVPVLPAEPAPRRGLARGAVRRARSQHPT